MSRVDIIVSTFNQPELLAACLRSLQAQTFQDFSLIVTDDHSDPPARGTVRSIFPDATIVRSRQNAGLVRSLNAALSVSEAEYVVLLNDDTETEPWWLEELVKTADRHPECGSVASKLLIYGSNGTIHSAGDSYAVWGMPVNRGVWMPDVGQYDDQVEVFAACGGAALYRRTALDEVRLADGRILASELFMYCEDVDLAWRLQRAGFRCAFAPHAVVYHHLSASGGGALASYYVSRNVLLLLRTIPRQLVSKYRWRILAFHLGRVVRTALNVRQPAARASLRGTLAGAMQHLARRVLTSDPHPDDNDAELPRIEALLIDRDPPLS